MKSIKEKAEEHSKVFRSSIDEISKESYEAGASYVLGQIEDIVTHPQRYVSADRSVEEAMIEDIVKCIGKLKSGI